MRFISFIFSLFLCLPLQSIAQSELSDSDNALLNSINGLQNRCMVLRQLRAQVDVYNKAYKLQEQLFMRSLTDKQLSLYSEFQESLIKSDTAKVALADRKFQSSLNKKQIEQYDGLTGPLGKLVETRQYFYQQAAEFERDKSAWLLLAKIRARGDREMENMVDFFVQQKLTY